MKKTMTHANGHMRELNLAEFLAREGPWEEAPEGLALALTGLLGTQPRLFLRTREETDCDPPPADPWPRGQMEAAARHVFATGRVFASREAGVVATPILVGKETAGALLAALPEERSETSGGLLLLQVLALLVGCSLEGARLQLLLQSRLLHLGVPGGHSRSPGAPCPDPDKLARLVAKSFYQEMTRAGFTPENIIDAATEILSQLGKRVKRHSRRRTRPSQASPS